jgi:Protein of unknown function (DUF2911)
MPKKAPFAILFVFIVPAISFPQQSVNKHSASTAKAQCKFSDEEMITIDYSSHRVGGRKIFGGLVPYGEVWRTWPNEATTFVTSEDLVTVKGTNIPAGGYTILEVPYPAEWTLIINKDTVYDSEELARVPMSVTKLSSSVENFTISFDHTGASCTLRVSWENTQASLEFAERNTDLPRLRDPPTRRRP